MYRSPVGEVRMTGRLTGDWSHSIGPSEGLMVPAAKARMTAGQLSYQRRAAWNRGEGRSRD